MVLTICKQVAAMFIFMAVGFFLYKKKLVSDEGSRSIGNLLLDVVLPCAIVSAFCVHQTPERTFDLGVGFALSIGGLAIAIAVSALLFRRHPIDDFAGAFSNAGFIGIPLISGALGNDAVFYAAPYIAVLPVLQWTYGQWVLSGGSEKMDPKSVLLNPITIALAIGLVVYFVPFDMPEYAVGVVDAMAALNAPLAMIVIGVSLARSKVLDMLRVPRLYLTSLVRLLVVPCLTLAVMALLPRAWDPIALAVLLAAATPVGSNVTIFVQKLGGDTLYASQVVCISTVLCIVTIPVVAALAGAVLSV